MIDVLLSSKCMPTQYNINSHVVIRYYALTEFEVYFRYFCEHCQRPLNSMLT